MKTTLTFIVLLSLAGLSAAAAETASSSVPAVVSGAEASLGLFVVATLLMLLGTDYQQRRRRFQLRSSGPVLRPAAEAFGGAARVLFPSRRPRQRRTFRPAVKL